MWVWRILFFVVLAQALVPSKAPSSICADRKCALSSNLTRSVSISRIANQWNLPKTTTQPRKYGRPTGQQRNVGPVGRPRRTRVTGTTTRRPQQSPTAKRLSATKTKTKSKSKTRTKSHTGTQKPKQRPATRTNKHQKPQTTSTKRSKTHSRTRSHSRKWSSRPVSLLSPSSSVYLPSSRPESSTIPTDSVATPLPKSPWPGHKVIGYYSYHHVGTMPPNSLPWNQLTHVVFAFGTLDSTFSVTIPAKGQSAISTLFSTAKANGVKTVLSIGGWRGSTYFSEMVASNSSRSAFISSTMSVIRQYDIDGIDIDWEYPGRPGDTATPYDEVNDVPNLLLLIKQMRQTLGRNVELSAALSSSKPWSSNVREFADLLDYGSIMSYNFAGRGQSKSGAMAPLEGAASVSSGAMNWNNAGWPWHKLTLGIPGYGRSWTLVDVLLQPFLVS